MFPELDAFEVDQPAVRDIPPEIPVLDGSLHFLIELRKEQPSAFITKQARSEFGCKILWGYHVLVDELEDHPVDQQGLEDLGDVECQREAPLGWLVQERDGLVELCSVDRVDRLPVHERVPEADHRVERVCRGSTAPAPEREPGLEYRVERRIVGAPNVAFERQQLPDVPARCCRFRKRINFIEHTGKRLFLVLVVFEVPFDIRGRAGDEFPREREPLVLIEVMGCLPDVHLAGEQGFFREQRALVVAVVPEEMDGDVVLREERDDAGCEGDPAIAEDCIDLLHGKRALFELRLVGDVLGKLGALVIFIREVSRRSFGCRSAGRGGRPAALLFADKVKRVLFADDLPVFDQVQVLLHVHTQQNSKYAQDRQ